MRYPEIILMPIMALVDYFLTVISAIQIEKGYSQHFKTKHYELNPIWQKDIAKKKWFNPRHIFRTIALSLVMMCGLEFLDMPDDFNQAVLGGILITYAMVIGKHLSNLFIFRHFFRHRDEISGQVIMSHKLVLSISMYGSLAFIIPVAMVAIFTQSYFALGGTVGIAALFFHHLKWIRKAKKETTSSCKQVIDKDK